MCVIFHVEDGVTHPESWVGSETREKEDAAGLYAEPG